MSAVSCGNDLRFDGLSVAYKLTLWAVIAINGAKFVFELGAGTFAGSQALKADALGFLADTATYAITLFVIGMPLVWRARATLLKGLSLGPWDCGYWVAQPTTSLSLACRRQR